MTEQEARALRTGDRVGYVHTEIPELGRVLSNIGDLITFEWDDGHISDIGPMDDLSDFASDPE